MPSLLIAGPLTLDDLPQAKGMLGGAGGYAAMAAAPLAHTQLWARGGKDITPQVRAILERRGIDLAGATWDGPTIHSGKPQPQAYQPALPDVEPTEAEDVGAVLVIGLAPDEWRRAIRVVQGLPGADGRSLVAAPKPSDLEDERFRSEVCAAADVLIIPAAAAVALTVTTNPFDAARALGSLGAKCVILTAGPLGGLILYRQKATTYPALPVETVDGTGVSASFAGALGAWLTGAGKDDFRAIKRGCAVASGVAGICAQGIGPKKLLGADRKEYLERFNRLRRAAKG
jgi:sugar/nucleoside kinase (ribokinase family)